MRALTSAAVVTGVAILVACVGDASDGSFPDGPGVDPIPAPNLFRPDLGPTVVQAVRPPPIYGGTLLATTDGAYAIAADPDRDQIFVVDLATRKLHATIDTAPGAQPFRVTESTPGTVAVTLRGTGEVVTIDLAMGTASWTSPACVEPRGIAFDPSTKTLAIACERGEIVSLDAATGSKVGAVTVEATALRDIFVVEGDGFWVSDFRHVRVLRVDPSGVIRRRLAVNFVSGSTAWRTRRIGTDTFAISYQIATNVALQTAKPGGYGGADCSTGSVVTSVVSVLHDNGGVADHLLGNSPLPVDVAYAAATDRFLVAFAGNSWNSQLPKFHVLERFRTDLPPCSPMGAPPTNGEIVATEIGPGNVGLIQSREPATLQIVDLGNRSLIDTITLSQVSRRDTGHILFHANSGRGIACASCHPEGGDDGRVWTFTNAMRVDRERRTPSLRGTILGTAPYHWDGEEPTLDALFDEVMSRRMDGPPLDSGQRAAFASFLQQIPAPGRPTVGSDPAIARGDALFHGDGKCIGCHGDAKTPSTGLFDVGTGGTFGAPPLVGVSLRAPFMHDGCAGSLEQRFVPPCGGTDHGPKTLTDENKSDLVAYLKSL